MASKKNPEIVHLQVAKGKTVIRLCRTTQSPGFDGPYWARTSDLQLVELALSQLS